MRKIFPTKVTYENEFSFQNLGQNSNFTAEDTKVKRIFISQLGSIVSV